MRQVQTPFWQRCVLPHAAPQLPQFNWLLVTSVQTPLHGFCPTGQAHAPLTHTDPLLQTLPHSPQLPLSLPRSTHWRPQAVSPAAH
jgi:hypothetical protein